MFAQFERIKGAIFATMHYVNLHLHLLQKVHNIGETDSCPCEQHK